jgi:hypothetical protein
MGVLISIFYILVSYLSPPVVFGSLVEFHIEAILGLALFFVSLGPLAKSFLWKTPQTMALAGLSFAVFMSILLKGWGIGAVWHAWGFFSLSYSYFLVCLHLNTKRKLQFLVAVLLFACVYVEMRGIWELLYPLPASDALQSFRVELNSGLTILLTSYWMNFSDFSGAPTIPRLRGQGFINDPNDYAQLLLCTLPLLFIFWKKKNIVGNFLMVVLPICALCWGIYETHSRGAIVATAAMIIVAARRRIGVIPSIVLGGLLFVGARAMDFGAGRDISVQGGADRTILWGEGLQLLKSHPIFGVGFGEMANQAGMTMTAHNSIVVCGAELGMVGLYFWSFFLFPTLKDAYTVSSPEKVIEPTIQVAEDLPSPMGEPHKVDKEEINGLGKLVFLSFVGFFVSGMFLSRAFTITLFLLGGMAESVYQMALNRGMVGPRMEFGKVARYAVPFSLALVVGMYAAVLILGRLH